MSEELKEILEIINNRLYDIERRLEDLSDIERRLSALEYVTDTRSYYE